MVRMRACRNVTLCVRSTRLHEDNRMISHGNTNLSAEREIGEIRRFAKMFPTLPALYSNPEELADLGRAGGPMDAGDTIERSNVDAGFVFLGQFIDHDVTFDTMSTLDGTNSATALRNARTPLLDLDCVYGTGPEAAPYLYVQETDTSGAKETHVFRGASLVEGEDDVQRAPNGRALIGDPRNDENAIISQLQLAFVRFHNATVRWVYSETGLEEGELYEEATRYVRWLYQWVVLRRFLPVMCGRRVVRDILATGRKLYLPGGGTPFMPIEFSVAAYRFGHSMVPSPLSYNASATNQGLFTLGTFSPPTAGAIEWNRFFGADAQKAHALDAKLAGVLLNLPGAIVGGSEPSLATRNLLRGNSFGLPSGQSVRAFVENALGSTIAAPVLSDLPGDTERYTPLWFYVLAEAGQLASGNHLGPVGGRIVAETLIGLLEEDPDSLLGAGRGWRPPAAFANGNGGFGMQRLLRIAANGYPQ